MRRKIDWGKVVEQHKTMPVRVMAARLKLSPWTIYNGMSRYRRNARREAGEGNDGTKRSAGRLTERNYLTKTIAMMTKKREALDRAIEVLKAVR